MTPQDILKNKKVYSPKLIKMGNRSLEEILKIVESVEKEQKEAQKKEKYDFFLPIRTRE